MKYIDLQTSFELEIAKFDDALNKPITDDIEYWLNIGLDKFVKTRYSGLNYKGEAFEQSQKRIDDLRTLLVRIVYQYPVDNIYNFQYTFRYHTTITQEEINAGNYLTVTKAFNEDKYIATLPEDYMFAIGEDTYIASANIDWPKIETGLPKPIHTSVIECTNDNITEKLNNSLSEHKLHRNYARPLRLYVNNTIVLHTDNNYVIDGFALTYLKYPTKINIHANPFNEYIDMPVHTHIEIVKLAAQAYLENQANQRYNSYSNEINTME